MDSMQDSMQDMRETTQETSQNQTQHLAQDSTPLLRIDNLCCGYGKHEIVHNASFSMEAGEFICIIGANGCGKSTLLKNILHLNKPDAGSVSICGEDVAHLSDAERARLYAYLPQEHTPPFPFSVADVVLMGRTPHLDGLSRIQQHDRQIVWDVLELLGIADLAASEYTQLSGGQRQLVLIARCLAQQPKLIVMDEPTAALDFGNQQIVLSRMRELSQSGMGVLMVTHDPAHVFVCGSRVLVMKEGRLVANGSPSDVMTQEMLEEIYDTPVDVLDVTLSNGKQSTVCVPLQ